MRKQTTGRGARLHELRDTAAANPESAKAHMNLGVALLKAGFVSKAERSLRKAVALEPNYAEAWSNLGGALLFQWDFNACLEANRRALECRPDLVQAHYNIGLCHLYQGNAKKVVDSFRQVIELERTNAGGHYYLAVGLHADGRVEDARLSLGRAIALGHTPEPEFLKAMENQSPPSPEANAGEAGEPAPFVVEFDPSSKDNK